MHSLQLDLQYTKQLTLTNRSKQTNMIYLNLNSTYNDVTNQDVSEERNYDDQGIRQADTGDGKCIEL